ncbi:TfoX/Sxy family protein [Schumannella sp. 10F1B-5-1]|uniref:TfoX/Sxy family protein n=1 Tax=Schumannella sp. 10F1B-5-1 TaxID=2590780 RepID=UPI001131288F|nr:TfoX/Sxy family protein [Schumannella sp. 10F1B-5-1]TPW70742.1 TfoX/Sxy family protein [Schumannella sp. 10F1B-5-1]
MTAADRDHERLERLAAPLLARPGVDWGRMFGTIGLRLRGKVFAVAVDSGGLMAKVPATRADELEAAGQAEWMVMAGRPRREWVVVGADATDSDWSALLDESHRYLDEITP